MLSTGVSKTDVSQPYNPRNVQTYEPEYSKETSNSQSNSTARGKIRKKTGKNKLKGEEV